jgi:hypothetical protein
MGSRRQTPGQFKIEIVGILGPGVWVDLPPVRRPQVHHGESQGTGQRTIGKADYQARGVLYLPEAARMYRTNPLFLVSWQVDLGRLNV